jgi:hypothetical protein
MVGVKVQACRDEVEEQGRQTNKITKYKCRSAGPLVAELNVARPIAID